MKTIIIISIILLMPYWSISQNDVPILKFTNDVGYKVLLAEEGHSFGRSLHTSEGNKFVFINFSFTNYSTSKKQLDISKILLIDTAKRIAYRPHYCILPDLFDIPVKAHFKLKPSETKNRGLIYNCPEMFKPEFLLINNKITKIA